MNAKRKHKSSVKYLCSVNLLLLLAIISACLVLFIRSKDNHGISSQQAINYDEVGYFSFSVHDQQIPRYHGTAYFKVNDDIPFFTEEELSDNSGFEFYYDLDHLGRATGACALVSKDTIPEYDREELQYKPSGWVQANYDFIDNGGWLYNRCHLISFSLTGQQDNPNNLITGTRQFNLAMTPFELEVLQYISYYNAHVR